MFGPFNVFHLLLFGAKLIVLVLLITSNFIVVLTYGVGTGERHVRLWRTCTPTEDSCFATNSNSLCSEFASRMKVAISFGFISMLSSISIIVVVIAERYNVKIPSYLDLGLLGWSGLADVISIGIVVSTLLVRLCGDPTPYRDNHGSPTAGFALICIAAGFDFGCLGLLHLAKSRAKQDEMSTTTARYDSSTNDAEDSML